MILVSCSCDFFLFFFVFLYWNIFLISTCTISQRVLCWWFSDDLYKYDHNIIPGSTPPPPVIKCYALANPRPLPRQGHNVICEWPHTFKNPIRVTWIGNHSPNWPFAHVFTFYPSQQPMRILAAAHLKHWFIGEFNTFKIRVKSSHDKDLPRISELESTF